ncbi:hypothetical protein HBNXHr_0469 [Halorhabdus sp. BNX81]|nr:hypothetical protein HBNXHr_0469 [Halorhabdus sp. BNX81]
MNNPELLRNILNQKAESILQIAHERVDKPIFLRKYGPGTDIVTEDWDNLILLDACRYDVFDSIQEIEGDLDEVISVASRTSQFIEKTFNGRELHDTVYISSNPHTDMTLDGGVFHDVLRTYGKEWEPDVERNQECFHPEHVFDVVSDVYEQYENKRCIIHFMQPHGPYFGETARTLRQSLNENENIGFQRLNESNNDPKRMYPDLMWAAEAGYISQEKIQTIYRENLKLVLEYVEKLLPHLKGKTVITADHGELLGDSSAVFSPRKYGHLKTQYVPELRTVPWLEVPYDERKQVTTTPPRQVSNIDSQRVAKQLDQLGYMTYETAGGRYVPIGLSKPPAFGEY